jgi:WD40 repeat protein
LIHIISLKRSKVITVLKGHSNTVTNLMAHPSKPELLLSSSSDGTIKLWNIHAEKGKKCVQTWQEKATALCFLKDGKRFLFGSSDGRITELDIENPNFNFLVPVKASKTVGKRLKLETNSTDCIKLVENNIVASRSIDGKINIWDRDSQCTVSVSFSGPAGGTKFDISQDKQLLCVGTTTGRVYVYDITNGKRLHELEYKRSRKEVKECAFSKDSK